MAETTIMNVADDFSVDKYSPAPWICRDDSGYYWTVVRDISGNLRIYKSIDSGVTWLLKKTLTNSDWINGDPLPTDDFQIINLKGNNYIYINVYKADGGCGWHYSWKIDTSTDLGYKCLDKARVSPSSNCSLREIHVAFDKYNNRLLVVSGDSYNPATMNYYGSINWTSNIVIFNGTITNYPIMSYYISPSDGYGYALSFENINIRLFKKKNDTDFKGDLGTVTIATFITESNLIFANVVTDSDGNPIVGYVYNDGGISPKLFIEKLDKNNLSNTLLDINHTIVSGAIPSSAYLTIDGNNNLYFIFTDGSDGECYYIKYGGSWGSEVKVSSNNDGQLVSAEVRVPIDSTILLLTYQATA